jgi:hypothetical protein
MDPNLFHLDLERVGEVLIAIVLLSLLVERALALLFESRPFIEATEDGSVVIQMKNLTPDNPKYARISKQSKKNGLKESISFIVAFAICWYLKFDVLTIIFVSSEETTVIGYLISGAIVAGGSKGAIKLFKDWMGFASSAETERKTIKESLRKNPNTN